MPKPSTLGVLTFEDHYGVYCEHCGDYLRSADKSKEWRGVILEIAVKGCETCRNHGEEGSLVKTNRRLLTPVIVSKTTEGEWVS